MLMADSAGVTCPRICRRRETESSGLVAVDLWIRLLDEAVSREVDHDRPEQGLCSERLRGGGFGSGGDQ